MLHASLISRLITGLDDVFRHVGPEARSAVDAHIRKLVPEFIEYTFTKSAPYRNHWVGGGRAGNYGEDYRTRTVANYAGIWANTPDEVLYFIATRDVNEQTLNGSNSYVGRGIADRSIRDHHARRQATPPQRTN